MRGPDAPEPSSGRGDHFAQAVRDPEGMEYFVQAVPAFGGSGPVWVGYADDPTKSGRLLKFVNRALTKVQPSVRRHETAMVLVTRRGDQKDLVSDDVPTLAEAFQRAEAIVSQIKAGTFRGRP